VVVVVRSRCAVEVWGVWVVCCGANADVVPMREVRIDRIVNALILMFIFVIVIIAFSSLLALWFRSFVWEIIGR